MALLLLLLLEPMAVDCQPSTGYNYSSPGTITVAPGNCQVSSCTTQYATANCSIGYFLKGCGTNPDVNNAANNYASLGTCAACR